jgi:hypothetical protein
MTALTENVRLLVPTAAALARVLGISPPAVSKALGRGKINSEPNGAFDVLACVQSWRHYTWPSLQRPNATRLPCLQPWHGFTDDDLRVLIVRTRAEGGEVLECDDDGEWEPVPLLADVLRAGTPLGIASSLELDEVGADGSWWYAQPGVWAPALAARLELDQDVVRDALRAAMRGSLAELAERRT